VPISSKSQQIHGEDALSLPDCTSRAELLDMSPQERALYEIAACADGCPTWLAASAKEHHVFPTDRIDERRMACSHCYFSLRSSLQRQHKHFHLWPRAARAAWSALHPQAVESDPNSPLYSGAAHIHAPFSPALAQLHTTPPTPYR
jgi:hypothetical protein